MKTVILAGGLPSTLSEEKNNIPKPMAEIGGRPLLWHIMKQYSYYGFNDFIISTGYKADIIKDYFLNYYIYQSDITVDLATNDVTIHNNVSEPWKVTIVDTGLSTTTASRIAASQKYIDEDEFFVVYGDCLSNIPVADMLQKHKESNKMMTMAISSPAGRNRILPLTKQGNIADRKGSEIPEDAWVNACNYVVSKEIFDIPGGLAGRLESETVHLLAKKGEVTTYKHRGFWLPVETMRDKLYLETKWEENKAEWKVWND